jgi:hypothetical protein
VPRTLQDAVTASWPALDGLTNTTASFHRADRALTLHMLEGVAPRTFTTLGLQASLDAALETLTQVPNGFEPGLDPFEAMARLDALYLRDLRGLPVAPFSKGDLRALIEGMKAQGNDLFAWLFAELARPLGVDVEARVGLVMRLRSPLIPLYELTHVVLVDTGYLLRPASEGSRALAPRLLEGATWAAGQGQLDILGELLFCLGAVGARIDEGLLAPLLAAQHADGHFEDAGTLGTTGPAADRERAHTTAAAWLGLAAALEQR